MSPRERIAENLVKARRTAGITQDQLADRCNLHRTEISLLERAGREPRLGTLIKLADGLQINLEKLIEGIGWDEERQRFRIDR